LFFFSHQKLGEKMAALAKPKRIYTQLALKNLLCTVNKPCSPCSSKKPIKTKDRKIAIFAIEVID